MAQKPHRDPGTICPLRNKDVSKVCHTCDWYVQLRGMHPQTGAEVDTWGCAISFLPILTVENSNQQRQTAAAVNSFHNEMSRNQAAALLGRDHRPGTHVIGSAPINSVPLNGRLIHHEDDEE